MDCIYCVVDMHAITQAQDVWGGPEGLTRATREVTAAYIACGLDPRRSIIFNQSQVAEHAELGWIFNCVARLGWLNRMTQFKEKAGKDRENASRRNSTMISARASRSLVLGRLTFRNPNP
jgi:tryptophanyl-tRNA synthetase